MSAAAEAPTQPVEPGVLRLNRAVHSLVTEHAMPLVDAVNLCCRLEQLAPRCWPMRFGAVVESTAMRVRDVRPWLLAHGYMTQRELDSSERGAA